jgi:DNA-binding transcriptional LysR family regulator
VSHHLSRLEAATGVKLVQRIGRGIRLTPEGRLLAATVAQAYPGIELSLIDRHPVEAL